MLLIVTMLAFGAVREAGFVVPKGWKPPVYSFAKNPPTEEGIELGKMLFYDPVLSRDSSISCGSCHLSFTAFTHIDHDLSHGIAGRIGTRNSPTLMNLAWATSFMWDGAVNHLDMQALAPIAHPNEMDSNIETVVKKLQRLPRYKAAFHQAFGDSLVSGERVLKAFSQFMLTLVSANSKYDKVMRGEQGAVFNEYEARGYALFKTHCASCHTEPLFTNFTFENNGLAPDTLLKDIGRMRITGQIADSLKFKVPTLRNVEVSYPYMHDGRFPNLPMVLFHYTEGIHQSPTLAPALRRKISLSEEDKRAFIAFLHALTDEEFLHNPKFRYEN